MRKRVKKPRIAPSPVQSELRKRCEQDAQEAIQAIERATAEHPYSAPSLKTHGRNLTRFAMYLAQSGNTLRSATQESAIGFLETLSAMKMAQSTINLYRQAIEAMFKAMGKDEEISPMMRVMAQVEKSKRHKRIRGAYTKVQIDLICTHLSERYALATRILYETGMRAEEILTLRPRTERVPEEGLDGSDGLVALPRNQLFGKENCVPYTVVNKQFAGVGKRKEGTRKAVRREVWIPIGLSKELETYRRPEPVVVSDLGNKMESLYTIQGGTRLTHAFSVASQRALGWSRGITGMLCTYAQNRADFLTETLSYATALEIITVEMGNSSSKATYRLFV